jgi:hypothetical protein
MENVNKEYKLVFNAGVARKLLKMGVAIVDIKADRANKDKTVFVFKRSPEFEAAFAQINDEIKNAKTEAVVE